MIDVFELELLSLIASKNCDAINEEILESGECDKNNIFFYCSIPLLDVGICVSYELLIFELEDFCFILLSIFCNGDGLCWISCLNDCRILEIVATPKFSSYGENFSAFANESLEI